MAQLRWREDSDLVAKLKSLGVRWEKRQVTLDEIDFEGSKMNNARNDPYDENVSLEFATAMLNGDMFPSVCLRVPDAGYRKFPILSGVHRTGAVGLLVSGGDVSADEPIEVFVVPSDNPMLCELIERAANRWHGRRTGTEKAVMDAQWMMDRYGLTAKECARHFCLKPDALTKYIRRSKTSDRLTAAGVDVSKLGPGAIDRVGQLDFNERIQDRVARTIAAHKPTASQSADLVAQTKIAAKRSEQDGIAAIKDWEDRLRQDAPLLKQAPARTRTNYRARFFTQLVSLHNFMLRGNAGGPFYSLLDLHVVDIHDQKEIRVRWRELKRSIDEAFRATDADQAAKKRTTATVTSKARRKKVSK